MIRIVFVATLIDVTDKSEPGNIRSNLIIFYYRSQQITL